MKHRAKTLGELKKGDYTYRSIKDELRANLIDRLEAGIPSFERVLGFEDTVIPELERAILAKHNINLLGLRGQAKTTIARLMVELLDEYIPIIEGSELNEDPLKPLTKRSVDMIGEMGDKTPIQWIHRNERYSEKLATPDVSIADLIGDIDPIKASNLKLSYSDEGAIHYGLIPHANRGIFVINEIPDLQPRIQVALFNMLQEGDIQIRGFKLRLPLDIQFVFTANPEDYTNRGSIITPLKDRIQSQIMTHYPLNLEIAKSITKQEAQLDSKVKHKIQIPDLLARLVEQVAMAARDSEFVDQKSGVSARLSTSAYECMVASAEQRMIRNNEKSASVRIGDLLAIIPAITGKIELVYEGEQEGAIQVAHSLIRQALRNEFALYYPAPERLKSSKSTSPYQETLNWFSNQEFVLSNDLREDEYVKALKKVKPLFGLVERYVTNISEAEKNLHAEFVLHGLSEFSLLSKKGLNNRFHFNDILGGMLN
jgi:magnesium chelatase subunit I